MEVSGVQGKPQLHKKFKNNLGYICGGAQFWKYYPMINWYYYRKIFNS